MNEKEFAELSAAAALHALSEVDERRYRAELAARPELRAQQEADVEAAALLGDAVAPLTPPPGIRSALLAQIAETPQASAADAPAHAPADTPADAHAPADAPAPAAIAPLRRHPMRVLFALAAGIALVVGIGIGVAVLGDQLNRPASVVALERVEAAADAEQATVTLEQGGQATAHWSASLGTAVLVTAGLDAPGEGKTYELWFVRGETPVPAGVFAVDGGEATAVLDGPMHAGDVIAVTVEQEGGSPSGAPTTDPVIVIPTA